MFRPMKRIIVSQAELAKAVLVWLRVAPKQVWRKYEAYERLVAAKRHKIEDEPRAREEIAAYIAAKVSQAGWEVSYEERKPFRDGPPADRE
jgi:hypothetical protein